MVLFMKKDSLQGDMRFLDVLEQMGCTKQWGHMEETGEPALKISGPVNGVLHGIDINMSDFSDQTLTLAAIAPFADSPVTIRGVSHIREQESDRLYVIVTELERMGIRCDMFEDGVTIYPGEPKGAQIETYQDHRVAMAFAVTGLRTPGVEILNPGCCRKTFADYFNVFSIIFNQK